MKNDIWHPVSEKPEKDGWIVEAWVIDKPLVFPQKSRIISPEKYRVQEDWESRVKEKGIQEWAYYEEWLERNQSVYTERGKK